MSNDNIKNITKKLNDVSPGFCLAKWTQVTVHLQTGLTHSCHHPVPHKIPLKEIQESSDALHNTQYKMIQRKKMLEGDRPIECQYCWGIEDSHPENISDRTYKSAEDWSLPDFESIKSSKWDERVMPRYLEVSFGIECNFKCAYCVPNVSSSILNEYLKYGHYKENPFYEIENLKKFGQYPISKDEPNPYLDAFWDWWPKIKKHLKVFRLTGGEPLLAPSTFKLLEDFLNDGLANLDFAINSNFGISDSNFDRFIELSKRIISEKKVGKFEVYTSIDTYGEQAEYIRYGLNYQKFLVNVRRYLTEVPDVKIIFMVTYNALSVTKFSELLKDVLKLKSEFNIKPDNIPRVMIDISYLRNPHMLNCHILTKDFSSYMERDLEFMKSSHIEGHPWSPAFYEHEISKMERLLNWFLSENEDIVTRRITTNRRCFHSFLEEYDKRKRISFDKTFPEMKDFRDLCKSLEHKEE